MTIVYGLISRPATEAGNDPNAGGSMPGLDEIIATYNDAWNSHDLDAICGAHAPGMVFENHNAGERADGDAVRGFADAVAVTAARLFFAQLVDGRGGALDGGACELPATVRDGGGCFKERERSDHRCRVLLHRACQANAALGRG